MYLIHDALVNTRNGGYRVMSEESGYGQQLNKTHFKCSCFACVCVQF